MLLKILPNAAIINGYLLATEFQPLHRSTGRNRLGIVGRWIQRARQRAALADLDDRLRDDIAVTRPQAANEVAKGFWQA